MLEFNVTNQSLKRVDKFSPATDSVDYLKAQFKFLTDDWTGKTKKALFRSGTVSYEAAINADGVCNIPWEILVAPDNKFSALSGGCVKIFVSVVGTSGTVTLPTKECRVEMSVSGLTETLNGAEPTPDIYEQFVSTIQADNDTTVEEIKADNDETVEEIATNNTNTKAEVEALTERAEAAQTSAEQSAASMKNDYANALKGTASGEVVRVDDVSPVEHNPVVKVKSKNLIPYPYFSKDSLDVDGITYAIDNDGKLTISGTNEKGTNWYLARNFNLEKGAYIFSYSGSLSGVNILLYCPSKKILVAGLSEHINAVPFVVDETMPDCNIYINIDKVGTTVSGSFYVQLEEGDTATEYTPYIDPSTVTLTRCGKNLIPLPYKDGGIGDQYTNAGITYTVNPNGSITANGTATTNSYFRLCNVGFGEAYIYENSAIGGFACSDCQYDDGNEFTFIMIGKGETVTNKVYYPQVEVGTVVTEYEKPQEQVTYTPEANGTCDIVTVAPTMTLLTDTEGVTVECEYNRDINAVIADLYSKLG